MKFNSSQCSDSCNMSIAYEYRSPLGSTFVNNDPIMFHFVYTSTKCTLQNKQIKNLGHKFFYDFFIINVCLIMLMLMQSICNEPIQSCFLVNSGKIFFFSLTFIVYTYLLQSLIFYNHNFFLFFIQH